MSKSNGNRVEDQGSIPAKSCNIPVFLYENEVKFPVRALYMLHPLQHQGQNGSEACPTGASSTFRGDRRSTKREGDNSSLFGGEVKVNIR
jgi:hypothetical protein